MSPKSSLGDCESSLHTRAPARGRGKDGSAPNWMDLSMHRDSGNDSPLLECEWKHDWLLETPSRQTEARPEEGRGPPRRPPMT